MVAREELVCLSVQADAAANLFKLCLQNLDVLSVLTICLVGVLFALALTSAVFELLTQAVTSILPDIELVLQTYVVDGQRSGCSMHDCSI